MAADAENDDNISEQRRQHGKRVRYGEVIQVRKQNIQWAFLYLYWLK